MNQVTKLKKMGNLSYFDKNTLSQMVELSDNSLYANIKRWIKSGRIIQLKKGMYVTDFFLSTLPDKTPYAEFIANKLREPSYLSTEYILQKYGILTEAVYGYTSITLKSKIIYQNDLATFLYNNISEKLFTGYTIKTSGKFSIFEATKVKALFDYLYLKLFRITNITEELFDSLRLNLNELTGQDIKEFKKYCEIADINKFRTLVKIIGEKSDLSRARKNS